MYYYNFRLYGTHPNGIASNWDTSNWDTSNWEASIWDDTNWNTLLQKTFKLGQNVYLGKILVKFEYGLSWICPSVCQSVRLSVRPSVRPSVHIFFVLALLMSTHDIFLHEKICCGYLLEAPQ